MSNRRDLLVVALSFLMLALIPVFLLAVLKLREPEIDTSEENLTEGLFFDRKERDLDELKPVGLKQFGSDEEFKEYFKEAEKSYRINSWDALEGATMAMGETAPMTAEGFGKADSEPKAFRYSETNVQVQGIDEPDIVKTDGTEIYYSTPSLMLYRASIGDESISEPMVIEGMPSILPSQPGGIKLIKAFPVGDLGLDFDLKETQGDLLLAGNNLIVISQNREILGFDITDKKNPQRKWQFELENNNQIQAVRLYGDKIYLITRTTLLGLGENLCPLPAYKQEESRVSIDCTRIYRPQEPTQVDSVYNVMILNSDNGGVEEMISLVGSTSQTNFYMSNNALYLSYFYELDIFDALVKLFETNKDIIPQEFIAKIKEINDGKAPSWNKYNELSQLVSEWEKTLPQDEKLRLENELQNRMRDYLEKNKRALAKTQIVKIDKNNLNIATSGVVPGSLLNQFSMDEYNGSLRVAVTIGQNLEFWGLPGAGFSNRDKTVNDVYVLDNDLNRVGSVRDLGKGERIYSVRFLEEKGYVVTFRETDPFYVLNLADSGNPQKTGELKIPGYSSYLHPIAKDKILGIGQEEGMVKLSLFDVADPSNPVEQSKYLLDEYWSEALNNHHAFMQDSRNQIFFIPGSKGGYVFSYAGNVLSLKRAVADIQTKRALYLNNYLYVIGDSQVRVFDERDWSEVKNLDF